MFFNFNSIFHPEKTKQNQSDTINTIPVNKSIATSINTQGEYIKREDVLNIINYMRTTYIRNYNRRNKCNQFWSDTIRYFEKKVCSLPSVDMTNKENSGGIEEGNNNA